MTDEAVGSGEIQIGEDAQRIGAALDEAMLWLIQRVINVLGVSRADDLLQMTIKTEAEGGLLTVDGDRRRTPGGVFFKLVKEQTTKQERKAIFSSGPGGKKKEQEPNQVKAPSTPIVPITWDEAKVEVARILKAPLGRASVKVTLVGRPTQVSKTRSCVVVAMKGSPPPSLPKGLPAMPEGSDFSYAVFIATKQWAKVAPSMAQDKDDKLIVEGYPIFDAKRGITVVLAQSVRTIATQRAARNNRRSDS